MKGPWTGQRTSKGADPLDPALSGPGGVAMAGFESMGKFTAVGMRTKIGDPSALVINTCSGNDTDERGEFRSWTWANPTNRAIVHHYEGCRAASVECLWQGTKVFREGGVPDEITLGGAWRRGKAKKPLGAWAGEGKPLITDPGEARRRIYVPAFRGLVEHWMRDDIVARWVEDARKWDGPVFLRDHDTGRGLDRQGPMSHAWLLCMRLNTGDWAFAD